MTRPPSTKKRLLPSRIKSRRVKCLKIRRLILDATVECTVIWEIYSQRRVRLWFRWEEARVKRHSRGVIVTTPLKICTMWEANDRYWIRAIWVSIQCRLKPNKTALIARRSACCPTWSSCRRILARIARSRPSAITRQISIRLVTASNQMVVTGGCSRKLFRCILLSRWTRRTPLVIRRILTHLQESCRTCRRRARAKAKCISEVLGRKGRRKSLPRRFWPTSVKWQVLSPRRTQSRRKSTNRKDLSALFSLWSNRQANSAQTQSWATCIPAKTSSAGEALSCQDVSHQDYLQSRRILWMRRK